MTRLPILLATASLLALAGCGDVIKFPGSDAPPPAVGTPPPPPLEPVDGDTGTTDPVDPVDVGTPVTDPVNTTDPVGPSDITDPDGSDGGDTDPDTDPATDATTDPDTDTDTGDATDPDAPTPASISDLSSINAMICPASDEPTMTVAEVAGAGEPEARVGTAVVNGGLADRADYPGIVKLEPRRRIEGNRTSSGHCGATRIADRWFITAAHCLDSKYDEVTIVAGVNNLRNPAAQRLTVDATLCHSAYGGSSEDYANDIALMKVSEAVATELDAQTVPVVRYGATEKPLGNANYPTAQMAGWGLTGFGTSLSIDLLSAELRINNAGPAIISIASKGGSGPCIGDSGGPLYVTEADGDKTVVGVLSVVENNLTTGNFCEGQYNGRYTNLQGFQPWIDAVISACDADASGELCKE